MDFDFTFFLLLMSNGVLIGLMYSLIALGFVLVYKATDAINFAQGEMAMFSTYIAWSLIQAGFPYWVAFFVTLAISFAGGLAIERVIVRHFHDAPVLNGVIVALNF